MSLQKFVIALCFAPPVAFAICGTVVADNQSEKTTEVLKQQYLLDLDGITYPAASYIRHSRNCDILPSLKYEIRSELLTLNTGILQRPDLTYQKIEVRLDAMSYADSACDTNELSRWQESYHYYQDRLRETHATLRLRGVF